MIVGSSILACLPRILVPTDETPEVIRFAAKVAKATNAAIVSLYVQPRPESGDSGYRNSDRDPFSFANDLKAQAAIQSARAICLDVGVPVLQIYAVHNCRGEMMLDHAATWGVEAVVMGGARKQAKPTADCEPALNKVYKQLPSSIPLIIHD